MLVPPNGRKMRLDLVFIWWKQHVGHRIRRASVNPLRGGTHPSNQSGRVADATLTSQPRGCGRFEPLRAIPETNTSTISYRNLVGPRRPSLYTVIDQFVCVS